MKSVGSSMKDSVLPDVLGNTSAPHVVPTTPPPSAPPSQLSPQRRIREGIRASSRYLMGAMGTFSGVEHEPFSSHLPRYCRQLGYAGNSVHHVSRTVQYTLLDDALPRPPAHEYSFDAISTIHDNPHLFRVHTPINTERFIGLLASHPNPDLVSSVHIGLTEGFWPWATTKPSTDYPVTWDNSWAIFRSTSQRDFVNSQCNAESEALHHSPPFGPDLLPGMYATPIVAVPKPNSDKFRMVANQSAGKFCQNSMIDRAQTKGARLDDLRTFAPMLITFRRMHPGKKLVLWKSDVKGAFRLCPMHPLWQLKQVVTANLPTHDEVRAGLFNPRQLIRYVDWAACFGSCASPRIWATIIGLVAWIAVNILSIVSLCVYVDDCFSVGLMDDMVFYEPYKCYMPREQVLLLTLWDDLGIPHERQKQIFGSSIPIIGFQIDADALTASLPSQARSDFVYALREFAFTPSRIRTLHEWQQLSGWANWAFNIYPLLRPGLSNVYHKISGKQDSHATIYINKSVRGDLEWMARHVETSSGVLYLASFDWNSHTNADFVLYCDASLSGMGIWLPSLSLGLRAPTDPSSPMISRIFYWESLCVLSALQWMSTNVSFPSNPERPGRLTIWTDNSNTVSMFDSLSASPEYNDILRTSVDIRLKYNIDLRVLHVPGLDNTVADLLSRDKLTELIALVPTISILPFSPTCTLSNLDSPSPHQPDNPIVNDGPLKPSSNVGT